jgi:uncharacterized membrane protein
MGVCRYDTVINVVSEDDDNASVWIVNAPSTYSVNVYVRVSKRRRRRIEARRKPRSLC